MYNQKKLNLIKKAGFALLALLVLIVVVFGSFTAGKLSKQASTKTPQVKTVKQESKLSDKAVNGFLLAYYTKKDLGENNNRYKPLMTEAMFKEAQADENLPVNQAYKGYVIDQVFKESTNYIDEKNMVAICVVTYTNTQLSQLNSTVGAVIDQANSDTIRLSFTKSGDKYLVNDIESMVLKTGSESATDSILGSNDYTASSSSSTSSSQTTASSTPKESK